MKLRTYQVDTLDNICKAEERGIRRQLAVLATGLGKTVIFCSIGKVRPKSYPMLIIAHREELLDQAADKIRQINPELTVSKEQAKEYGSLESDVVVASVQTLGTARGRARLEKYPKDHFKVVVVDEAHHAAANTYKNILEYFTPDLLLGVTATPQRTDKVGLSSAFDEVVAYYPIDYGIDNKFLSPLRGHRVKTNADISDVSVSNGDYGVAELAAAIDTNDRNNLVATSYLKFLKNQPTIVFAVNVEHAHNLVGVFNQFGINTAAIDAKTKREDRADIYTRFRAGDIKVLINVGVLTEGFDEPSVSGIILARPTKSPLTYTQMIGRGTRLYEGKDFCLIIDLADATKNKVPYGLPSTLGLPPDFDLDGADLSEVAQKFFELEEKSPSEAATVRSIQDIELAWERIDLMRPPPTPEIVLEHSKFIWSQVGESYIISPVSGTQISITPHLLGWEWKEKNSKDQVGKVTETLVGAFNQADKHILDNYPNECTLLSIESHWRGDPPTEKQIKFLRNKGIPVTTDLGKGEASQLIQRWIDEHPRSALQEAIIKRNQRKKQSKW